MTQTATASAISNIALELRDIAGHLNRNAVGKFEREQVESLIEDLELSDETVIRFLTILDKGFSEEDYVHIHGIVNTLVVESKRIDPNTELPW